MTKETSIQNSLNKIRPKLLDLTKRNRLLNFRETSLSILIIDELPAQVFNYLVNVQKEMILQPLPEPDEEGVDENNIPLQKKYIKGKGKKIKKSSLSEDKFQINLSEELPEMPASSGTLDEKYTDDRLQTKLYPEQLETKLRRISSTAKTIIEETGTNQLYLAMGFLEWRESASSEEFYSAPLILIPVELNKCAKLDARTKTFRYEIKYTDEDLMTNVTLAEKLKQEFNVALPEFDETKDPEEYFADVVSAIAQHKRWVVRRKIVLGFFTFSKLLMYLDLDPKRWPEEKNILKHSQIDGVLNGNELQDWDLLPESRIEEDNLADNLPLVLDADSSQHGAIADIIGGKSLVIEGPPGTGKSQTITNIIASALNSGKTVLFAAEKLAALEVVRRNLNKVGLGEFCLELHSHKAQKRKLLDELNERLKRKYRNVGDLDYEIGQLQRLRAHLHSYVELMKTAVGPKYETIYQVLWKAESYRAHFNAEPKFSIKNVNELKHHDIEENLSTLEEIANFIRDDVLSLRSSWNGFFTTNLHYGEELSLKSNIDNVLQKIQELAQGFNSFTKEIGIDLTSESVPFSAVEATLNLAIQDLPSSVLQNFFKNIIKTKPKETRSSLDLFADSLEEYNRESSLARRHLKSDVIINEQDIANLLNYCSSLTTLGLSYLPLTEVENIASTLNNLTTDIYTAMTYAQKLSDFGIAVPKTIVNLKSTFNIYDCMKGKPEIRHPDNLSSLLRDSTLQIFESLKQKSESILACQAKLKEDFSMPDLPSREEISKIRQIFRLKLGKPFSFFSSEYRQCKKKILSFLKIPTLLKNKSILAKLEELDSYLQAQSDFSDDKDQFIFGSYYKGHETNWNELYSLISWLRKLYEHTHSESAVVSISSISYDQSALLSADQNLTDLYERLMNNISRLASLNIQHQNLKKNFDDNAIDTLLAVLPEIRKNLIDASHGLLRISLNILSSAQVLNEALCALEKSFCVKKKLEATNLPLLFGTDFLGTESDINAAFATMKAVVTLQNSGIPILLADSIAENNYQNKIGAIMRFKSTYYPYVDEIKNTIQGLSQFGQLDEVIFFGTSISENSLSSLFQRLSLLLSAFQNALTWSDYCRLITKADESGLSGIVSLIESGDLPCDDIREHYLFSFYQSLSQFLIKKEELLSDFTRAKHEERRKKFSKLDTEILDLNRQKVAYIASLQKCPNGTSTGPIKTWTELALIKHEIGKSRKQIPIRKLVERAGVALQAIKPCFMMSPMSVAQYLQPGGLEFDILIMDEASQVRPHEALGPIARAKQIVIVGDSKQLPPTTFFDNVGDDNLSDENDMNLLDESDSILDVCVSANMPKRSLRWHYRSEHESLIAFSNSQFYDNDLIIFPSPDDTKTELGLVYRYVDGATYTSSKNLKEAQEVAKAISEHARQSPHYSLGVGAFNVQQKELIEDCLEQLKKNDPSLELAITNLNKSHEGHEPLFIKNLENIQGDERDVIFISCTYGRDPESGKVMNRFGPINGKFGWRRLNVMFTRAKRRMIIFTSMQPEDINAGPGSSEGANSLKKVLEYARSGRMPDFGIATGRDPDSDFEIAVSKTLQRHGYKVTPQVGVAGYFVDLGVNHPHRLGEYILGIECDGATYHSSRSARDRDRLKEEVLIKLGWELYRIWSTDWFKNRDSEIDRLIKYLKKLSVIKLEIEVAQ